MTPNDHINDVRITEIRELIAPRVLRERLPLTPRHEQLVRGSRASAADIVHGRDDRLLVVVGPCSVHDPIAALDYAKRLADVADALSEELFVVMRVYFEKPRTTVGWKGLINDPDLDGSFRMNEGLLAARQLLTDVLSVGIPVGCEFLDPITPQFIADAVSWGAIGARTSASQIHRQLASGLSMPIGFKNATDGAVQGAIDAVAAAASAQVFPGITEDGRAAIVSTQGNPDGHVVLRGGNSGPNYDEQSVAQTGELLERDGLGRRVIIDASHGNSGKDHRRQPLVAANVAERLASGEAGIAGIMLESFLVAGRQDLIADRTNQLVYGQSITDACIDWEQTVAVLERLSGAMAIRRRLGRA